MRLILATVFSPIDSRFDAVNGYNMLTRIGIFIPKLSTNKIPNSTHKDTQEYF